MLAATIETVAPFFNDATAAPPPFPPLLTDQQELFGKHTDCPSSLLADESLHPDGSMAVAAKPDPKTTPLSSQPPGLAISRPFKVAHRPSPYSKKAVGGKRLPAHGGCVSVASSSELSDNSSELSSDSDDTSSTLSEDSKISKPAGEPGRPGRGGYNLETALNWNHKAFSKFKKLTHRLIDEHLDTTKCASMQSPALLQVVRDKAVAAIPDLDNYSSCWPVNDIIMMRLKYTSGRARRQELEMAARKGKKAVKK